MAQQLDFIIRSDEPPFVNYADVNLLAKQAYDPNAKLYQEQVIREATKQFTQEDRQNFINSYVKAVLLDYGNRIVENIKLDNGNFINGYSDDTLKTAVGLYGNGQPTDFILNKIIKNNKIPFVETYNFLNGARSEAPSPDLTIKIDNKAFFDKLIESALGAKNKIPEMLEFAFQQFSTSDEINNSKEKLLKLAQDKRGNELYRFISDDFLGIYATNPQSRADNLKAILGIQSSNFTICPDFQLTDATSNIRYTLNQVVLVNKTDLTPDPNQTAGTGYFFTRSPGVKLSRSEFNSGTGTRECLRIVSFTDKNEVELALGISLVAIPEGETLQNATAPNAKAAEAALDVINSITQNFNRFEQQCLLIKQFNQLASVSTPLFNQEKNTIAYDNFVALRDRTLTTQQISELTNRINSPKDKFKNFVNMENQVASALVPKIKLYKTYLVNEGDTERKIDVEIPLEPYTTKEDILDIKTTRNFGFGLKSFSWDNTSMNEYDRNIRATMILRFSSLDAFVAERSNGRVTNLNENDKKKGYNKYSFLEFIYQVPSKVNDKDPAMDAAAAAQYQLNQRFKIKTAVGWNIEPNILKNIDKEYAYEEAIKSNNTIFYLYNIGHDINFEKDGSVTLTLHYQSAQEATMNDEVQSNILTEPKSKEALLRIKKELEKVEKEAEVATAVTRPFLEQQLEKLKNDKALLIERGSFEIYKKFLDYMFAKKIVKVARMSLADLVRTKVNLAPLLGGKPQPQPKFQFVDYYGSLSRSSGSAEDIKKAIDKLKSDIDTLLLSGTVFVPFFYLGDLLDIILENINSGSKLEKIRLITGPIIFEKYNIETIEKFQKQGYLTTEQKNSNNRLGINQNLAELPISFTFFLDWLEKIIIQQRVTKYTFKNFLSDLVNNFLINVLNPTCFGNKYKISPTPKIDVFILNATSKDELDRILPSNSLADKFGGTRIKLEDLVKRLDPIDNFSNNETNVIPYLYIQCIYANPLDEDGIIDEQEDARNGIFHFKLGTDRGIVKNINFIRDDLPNIPVAIYQENGSINPKVLRVPYNAEVETIGNTVFKPGSTVYIDPSFAVKNLNRQSSVDAIRYLGLGGYYTVVRSMSEISPGSFKTRLTCRFSRYGITKDEKREKIRKAQRASKK